MGCIWPQFGEEGRKEIKLQWLSEDYPGSVIFFFFHINLTAQAEAQKQFGNLSIHILIPILKQHKKENANDNRAGLKHKDLWVESEL